jgi:hypothetical protein
MSRPRPGSHDTYAPGRSRAPSLEPAREVRVVTPRDSATTVLFRAVRRSPCSQKGASDGSDFDRARAGAGTFITDCVAELGPVCPLCHCQPLANPFRCPGRPDGLFRSVIRRMPSRNEIVPWLEPLAERLSFYCRGTTGRVFRVTTIAID